MKLNLFIAQKGKIMFGLEDRLQNKLRDKIIKLKKEIKEPQRGKIMSWQLVFNTNLLFLEGSNRDDVMDFVRTTGYKFFTFNGLVYTINGSETGFTVEDLF